jgi:primosomal protein N' (replication factor Y)
MLRPGSLIAQYLALRDQPPDRIGLWIASPLSPHPRQESRLGYSVPMGQLFDTSPIPADPAQRYAQVALERGIDTHGLTYSIPPQLQGLRIGERVVVPLGRANKREIGYVVEVTDRCDFAKVKPIESRDPQSVALTEDLIKLAHWMAGYYCCPLGMVLATMLPAGVKHDTGRTKQTVVGLPGTEAETGTGADKPVPNKQEANKQAEQVASDELAVAEKTDGADDSADPKAKKDKKLKVTKLQRAVLDQAVALAKQGRPWVPIKELADCAGARTVTPVKQLIDKGMLIAQVHSVVKADRQGNLQLTDMMQAEDQADRLNLTDAQRIAVDRLCADVHKGFGVFLLLGVTGSGKTEVYLRLIEHLLNSKSNEPTSANSSQTLSKTESDAVSGGGAGTGVGTGAGAIILVPEIALTPQTVKRFLERFHCDDESRVAVLHSGLTAAQRHQQWRRIKDGKADIVVGARSAIFAPLPKLGVIIVDEEQESSYKQDQLPRYHARDVAIKRAQLLDIPVLLGSATPSLESYYNATHRKTHQLLTLPTRVAGLQLPHVAIVDMNEERRKRYQNTGKAGVHLLSLKLEHELQRTFKEGGQAMLLLNRRGYANYIACPDQRCGWMMYCDYCDASMIYHKSKTLPTGGNLRCHHCLAEQLLPSNCPICSKKISVFGLGTQRVEEEIERKFPDIKVLRMDRDTMKRGRDYFEALESFRTGEINLLVGTQMIGKGLDYPNVHVVGVISADTALHLPDFRASERTFQLVAQVAGRCGRGQTPGRVVVQTFQPNDPTIVAAAKHDYEGFAARELTLRAEASLPPISRMARIVVRHRDHAKCTEMASDLAGHLESFNTKLKLDIQLRGPMPCPIARVAEYHRYQIELIAPPPDAASRLQKLMTTLRNAKLLKSDHSTAVDVDPVALL